MALDRLSLSQLIRTYGKVTDSDVANILAAIALAESGGNSKAHNTKPPDNSYGLWQINMYGGMGPERRKKYGLATNDELFNPAVNARVAGAIYREQGLRAWSTYTNGSYRKYLDDNGEIKAPDAIKNLNPMNAVGGVLDTIKKWGIVAGIGVGALVLLILGVVILLRGPITSAIPMGKAAKAVKAVS